MSLSQPATLHAGWTRHLARDLFPGKATPFAWSVLRFPVQAALRRSYGELGARIGDEPLWQLARDAGGVYLNEDAVSAADASLQGAAWLGPERPAVKSGGLLSRLQTGGSARRIEGRLSQVPAEASELRNRSLQWLGWLRRLRWSQADLLQVMEELEPRATAALSTYFLARAGLAAAAVALQERLATPAQEPLGLLYAGLEVSPSLQAYGDLLAVAKANPDDPELLKVLTHCGHRGPGEARPDATRWADSHALLSDLAGQSPLHTAATAAAARAAAEAELRGRDEGRWRQAEPALSEARAHFIAADVAWDAVIMVLSAAQGWLTAVGAEARSTGIVAREGDVLFLELEELKQIATGEWHGGRSDDVETLVGARRAALAAAQPASPPPAKPIAIVPGQASGPAYCGAPVHTPPAPGAVWMAESPDPGAAPFWASTAALISASPDPWSPCMITARLIGLPAVAGATDAVKGAEAGRPVAVDAKAGIVRLSPVV